MSRYRKVDVRIWNDAKFGRLSNDGKFAFLFVLTHPHMTSLGAMRATISGLASELGIPAEAFREGLAEGLLIANEKASFIALPRFIKYNPPESPNVVKAWAKCLDLIPECDERARILLGAKGYAEALGEGFAKAYAKTMPNQEQEQEQEQDKNTKYSCAVPLAQHHPPEVSDKGVVVGVFPLRGKPSTHNVYESDLKTYQDLFPSLDVRSELKLAKQWLIEHPARMKTSRGIKAFITGWLKRSSDRKASQGPNNRKYNSSETIPTTANDRVERLRAQARAEKEKRND